MAGSVTISSAHCPSAVLQLRSRLSQGQGRAARPCRSFLEATVFAGTVSQVVDAAGDGGAELTVAVAATAAVIRSVCLSHHPSPLTPCCFHMPVTSEPFSVYPSMPLPLYLPPPSTTSSSAALVIACNIYILLLLIPRHLRIPVPDLPLSRHPCSLSPPHPIALRPPHPAPSSSSASVAWSVVSAPSASRSNPHPGPLRSQNSSVVMLIRPSAHSSPHWIVTRWMPYDPSSSSPSLIIPHHSSKDVTIRPSRPYHPP